MKKATMNMALGTLFSASVAAIAMAAYRKKQNDTPKVLEDTDIRNSEKIDKMESVDANKAPEEKGLTQYDSTLRNEWVANGFPQTHEEMEKLEAQGKDS